MPQKGGRKKEKSVYVFYFFTGNEKRFPKISGCGSIKAHHLLPSLIPANCGSKPVQRTTAFSFRCSFAASETIIQFWIHQPRMDSMCKNPCHQIGDNLQLFINCYFLLTSPSLPINIYWFPIITRLHLLLFASKIILKSI